MLLLNRKIGRCDCNLLNVARGVRETERTPWVAAVIQARMGSTRLPGKVLAQLADRSILSWVIRAATEAQVADEVVVATTTAPADDPVVAAASACGVRVVRGPEDDVLDRYLMSVGDHPDAVVVRLTADCPLLDPAVVRLAVRVFLAAEGSLDYLSTVLDRSLPRGLDVEVMSATTLREVATHAVGADRVHVTSGIYRHADRYRVAGLSFRPRADDLRVTVDTHEDLAVVRAVVRELGPSAPAWQDIVSLLRTRPDLCALNAEVRQKALEEG